MTGGLMVTPDDIRARIKTLQDEQAKLRDQIHAYSGAIQDCQFWLSQLEPDIHRERDSDNCQDPPGDE